MDKLMWCIRSHIVVLMVCVFGNGHAQESLSNESERIQTVFITGAAGFIGSNFLEFMFDKYPDYHFIVLDSLTYAGSLNNIPDRILSSRRFEFYEGSINDFELVDRIMAQSDYVVHFAAETHVENSIYSDEVFFETNVMGTRVLMASLVKNMDKVKRFIHISTSEVYGTAEYVPMDEGHPLNPRSPYAASKAGAERLVYSYMCTHDVPAVIIRPFNNYGARQYPEKVIPHFILSALNGMPLTIHGNGLQQRDWVHTRDVSIALDKVLHIGDFETVKHQEINIGSGRPTSVLEIAQMVLKELKLSDELIEFVDDRPGQVVCHFAGISKAKELLDWTPSIDMEEGIKETIDWYINNLSHWDLPEGTEHEEGHAA